MPATPRLPLLASLLALLAACTPRDSSELAEALSGSGAVTVRQLATRWLELRIEWPILHGALALGFVVALLISTLAAPARPEVTAYGRGRALVWLLRSRTTFFVLLWLVLLLCRAPSLALPELNPDESQLIAGALALKHDPRFWRSLDGTTFGPLDYYALLPVHLLGLPLDYGTAKLVGLLLAWGKVICLFFCLRCVFDERMSRILTLPLLVLHAGVITYFLLPYLSETFPCFLLALATAMTMRLARGIRSRAGMIVLGLVLAAVPFGKLQATPVALTLGVLALWFCWRNPAPHRVSAFACLLVTGVAAPLLFVGALWAKGEIDAFWASYIVFNTQHEVEPGTFWRYFWTAPSCWYYEPEFIALCVVCGLLLVFAASVPVLRRVRLRVSAPVCVAVLVLGTSLFAATYPCRPYLHYLYFMPFPAVLVSAFLAGHAYLVLPARAASRVVVPAAALLLLGAEAYRPLVAPKEGSIIIAGGTVASTALSYARPGEALSIWGWMPNFYVETGMYPVTRDVLTQRQIQPSPMREYYRRRYLGELAQNPPPVFLDAVGPENFFFTSRRAATPSFPELQSLLDARYEQVGDLSGSRILVRRDRVEEIELGTLLRDSPDTALVAPTHRSRVRLQLHTAGRAPILARNVTLLAPHRVGYERAALMWNSAGGGELLGHLKVLDARSGEVLLAGPQATLDLTQHRDLVLAFENWLDLSRDDLFVTFRGADGAPVLTLRSPWSGGGIDWERAFVTEPLAVLSEEPLKTLSFGKARVIAGRPPFELVFELDEVASRVRGEIGIPPRAQETQGARFTVELAHPDGRREVLLERVLRPLDRSEDLGLSSFEVELPRCHPGSRLVLRATSVSADQYVWACWHGIEVD